MTSDATKLVERPYIDMVKNQVPERTDGCLSMAGERALVDLIEAQQRKIEILRAALTASKPIVGAAVAKSDNASRPLREKVYDKIIAALSSTEPKVK